MPHSSRGSPDLGRSEMSMETNAVRHILVVEDDLSCRRLVTRMLEDAGFRVTAAADFSSAIEVIEGNDHVHLLLSDVHMPAGTPQGLSIGRMAQLRRPRLAVVYMTGAYDPARLSAEVPEARVLMKPFTTAVLLGTIEAALASGQKIKRLENIP